MKSSIFIILLISRYQLLLGQVSLPNIDITLGSAFFSDRPIQLLQDGKGVSSHLEMDLAFESDWIRIRLNPRAWSVQNRAIERFPVASMTPAQIAIYRNEFRRIDLPEQYGTSPYQRVHLGESRIAFGHRRVQMGVSTERRAWGAGERQQLLLSTNGFGFNHCFIELNRIPLGIASLSMDVIGGRLDSSGYARYPMPDEWRVISGLNVRLSPSFIPGLDVGLIRMFVQNASQVETVFDAFPFLQPFEKASLGAGTDGSGSQPDNQLASAFFRWRFEASKLSVYGEYARDDHSMDLRDALLEPDHMRAYVVGVMKGDEKTEIGAELVNVTQVNPQALRASGWWYTHSSVRHGHTHMGQLLGAEIGPGSRSQELWLRSHQTEISLRRVDVDRDLFNAAFSSGAYRPEVDWIVRARSEFRKGDFSLLPEVSVRHTRNRFYIPKNHETSVGVGLSMRWQFASVDQ